MVQVEISSEIYFTKIILIIKLWLFNLRTQAKLMC